MPTSTMRAKSPARSRAKSPARGGGRKATGEPSRKRRKAAGRPGPEGSDDSNGHLVQAE